MKEKKKKQPTGVGEKIFQIINLMLIIGILATYTYRAYKYKDYFDKLATAQVGEITLADALLEKANGDLSVFTDENGDHYYIDNPDNNYVRYSGRLFRVIKVYKNKTVKLASVDIEGISVLNENDDFTQSSLYRWLNVVPDYENSGIYEKTLSNSDKILTTGVFCTDKVDDASHIACTINSDKVKITMLTLEDYLSTGGAKGFLNNGKQYWMASNNSEGQFWYANEDGSLSVSDFDTQLVGIRPVIFIASDAMVVSGAGTSDDPFVLAGEAKAIYISDICTGSYVQYSNMMWRVTGQSEEGTELLLEGCVTENGEEKKVKYGTASRYSTDSGVGKYLNGTWVTTLDRYEKFLCEHTWYYGPTGTASSFDYAGSFDKSVNCYVAIPNLATPYLGGYNGILLSNYDAHNTDAIYIIDSEGRLFGDYDTVAYKVRPLIAMKPNVSIVSGKGTLEDPYIVEVNE